MDTWRAFTGLAEDSADGFAWVNRPGLTWEQAREVLRGELRQDMTGHGDDCADCRQQFEEALEALDAATPGQPVELVADGHDYLIVRDDVALPPAQDGQDGLLLLVRSRDG